MALTDPTDAGHSQVEKTDQPAATAEPEGAHGRERVYWLVAAALMAVAGIVWIVGSGKVVIGVVFIVVAMVFLLLAQGYQRRA